MKNWIKVILGVVGLIIVCVLIDVICIYTINRPLFAVQTENNGSMSKVYKGIFYDTYNCAEYSIHQIKLKGAKFVCAAGRDDIGKALEIVDKTKDIKDFSCASALEEFYEDEEYTYYFNCIKGKYIVVKYDSGYEEEVSNALKYGSVTIGDLDYYDINYIKYEK